MNIYCLCIVIESTSFWYESPPIYIDTFCCKMISYIFPLSQLGHWHGIYCLHNAITKVGDISDLINTTPVWVIYGYVSDGAWGKIEYHDDVIKWKHFPCYWPFVWGIHQSLVNSPHKGQWRGALMLSLIYAWTSCWVNNRYACDLRCHCTHFDVTVMSYKKQLL